MRESDTKLQYANEALWEAEAEIKKLREQVATLTADLYESDLALQEEGMAAGAMEMEAEIAVAKEEELERALEWAEKLERALRLACEMVASCTDCPGAQDDWPGCGGTARKCSNDEPACWKRYFLEEGGQDQ